MRWALLLCLLLIPIPTLANDWVDAPPAQVLMDNAADVAGITEAGVTVPAPPSALDHADLIGLDVHETPSAFEWTVHVAGGRDQERYSTITRWGVTHGTTEFLFEVQESMFQTVNEAVFDSPERAWMSRRPVGGTAWAGVTVMEYTSTDDSIRMEVEKDLLTDETGAPPLPGKQLTAFWATTQEWESDRTSVSVAPSPGAVAEWHDRMPNQGTDGALDILYGVASDNTVLLSSPDATRVSNGEEATYVYEVHAQNLADERRTFTFDAKDVPDAWSVDLPISAVELDPGASAPVPVVVATPFQHQHGTTVEFTVEATGLEGTSEAMLELGVHYTTIPQPSGHHPQLFMHSGRPADTEDVHARGIETNPFMSTLSDDPGSFHGPIGPRHSGRDAYQWCVSLAGGLAMGLDLTGAPAVLDMTLATNFLETSGTLEVVLIATDSTDDPRVEPTFCRDGIVLHRSEEPVVIPARCSTPLSIELPAMTDRVVPDDRGLHLGILYTPEIITDRQVDAIWIEPGASLHLGLQDYHAPPPDLGALGAAAAWIEPSVQTRAPGATALIPFTTSIAEPTFEVLGTRPDWATVVGPKGGQYALVVDVPEDAADEQANLVLRISGDGTALLRTVISVDPESVQDDGEKLEEWQTARATPLGWLPAVAAVCLLRRR